MPKMFSGEMLDPAAIARRTLHIVGNGPGDVPLLTPDEPLVRFNPPSTRSPSALEIFVSNHRHRGRRESAGRPFIVESTWLDGTGCQRFEEALAASAAALEERVGCFPSAGLATVHATLGMEMRLHVHRMPLRPDLHRPPGMGARQALPCAFHNWLGERRLALELLRGSSATQLSWASLRLALPKANRHPDGVSALTELLALLQQARPKEEAQVATQLARLAGRPLRAWMHDAQAPMLHALEPLLFLDRRSRDTGNWWLYSNRCAPALDTVLGCLMLAQQALDGQGPGAPARVQ